MKNLRRAITGAAVSAALASTASAGVIVSATSATASSTFGSNTPITNTIDQSGLSAGYASGVDDFDAYLTANPTHDLVFTEEWFTENGVAEASVDYDLGSVMTIGSLALWHEDAAGFTTAALSFSLDGVTYVPLTTIMPANNSANTDYGAQRFDFAAVALRYLRLDLSGCPKEDNNGFLGCGIGEVAFNRVADGMNAVPLPGAALLFGPALMGLGALRRARS